MKPDQLREFNELVKEELEAPEPCPHRFASQFPRIAKEYVIALQNGEEEQFSNDYSEMFDEIFACDKCVDEYIQAVQAFSKTKI